MTFDKKKRKMRKSKRSGEVKKDTGGFSDMDWREGRKYREREGHWD